MRSMSTVCVIDEDSKVELGWRCSLGSQANLEFFRDPHDLLNLVSSGKDKQAYSCIVVGKVFRSIGVDVTQGRLVEKLRSVFKVPIFLNWQGFILKSEMEKLFDGKIFQRYGVKWTTLKQRIHRATKSSSNKICPDGIPSSASDYLKADSEQKKIIRCQGLLKEMANRAHGNHKDKIEFYASSDHQTGIRLLEAIHNRLISFREIPQSCPSKYINSSPVIAARILEETLYPTEYKNHRFQFAK